MILLKIAALTILCWHFGMLMLSMSIIISIGVMTSRHPSVKFKYPTIWHHSVICGLAIYILLYM